jgi:peptide/nickel transport system substrate-binding protein
VKRLRKRGWVALLLALLVTVTACGGGSETGSEQAASAGGQVDPQAAVRVGWAAMPAQLDPHRAVSEPVEFRVLNLIYDRLLTINGDGSIGPMLAMEWQYSEDGSSLTLTLREDVRFRDGTPLDAAAVVINLERVRSLGSNVSARLADVTSVEASGPYEVRIGLAAPTTELTAALAMNAGMIINPSLLATGDPGATTDGSGPYVLEEFVPSVSMTLNRADDVKEYWDPQAAQVAHWEFTEIEDPRALTSALRSGQIDVAEIAASELVADVQSQIDQGDLTLTYAQQGTVVMAYFNRALAPLDDVEVRRAINQAIDRKALADAFLPGSDPAVQLFRDSHPAFDPELGDPYPFDPEAARGRLASAGYPGGVDLGPTMITGSLPSGLGEALQAMLADAGIRIELQVVDSVQISGEQPKGALPMYVNYGSNPGSTSAALQRRVGPGLNPAGTTPGFDTLYAAANDNRLTEDEQTDKWRAVSRYLAEEAWFAPMVHMSFPWVYRPEITGISEESPYMSTLGPYDLRYVAVTTGRPSQPAR